MLEHIDATEFQERFVAWDLSGDKDRWQQVSWIVTTICNQVTRYIDSKLSYKLPASAYMDPDQLVPKVLKTRKKKRRAAEIRPTDDPEILARHLGAI